MLIKGTIRNYKTEKEPRKQVDKQIENLNKTKPEQNVSKLQQNNTPNHDFLEMFKSLQHNMEQKINSINAQIQQLISIQKFYLPLAPPNPASLKKFQVTTNPPFYNPMHSHPPQPPINQMKSF